MSACSELSDDRRFVVELAPIELLETWPPPGGTLPAGAPISLCLSDIVDPRSVGGTDAIIGSGKVIVDVRTDVQLLPWTEGALASCEGSVVTVTPQEALERGVTWRLRWKPSLRAWSGASLLARGPGWLEQEPQPTFILEFTAGDADPPPPQTQLSLRDLFGDGQVFDPSDSNCGCHQSTASSQNETALTLLDLSTPERAYDALVPPTRMRDTGFPMVTPGRPSESFLIHKLLRDEDGGALRTVRGHPMPPEHPLAPEDLAAVAQWIASGANP